MGKKLLIKFSIGLMAFMLLVNTAYAELRTSVSQYGITWTFSAAAECGQFVNGDWWVIGPVTITNITKPHGVNGHDGSMINPIPASGQGYDQQVAGYSSSLDVSRSLPFTLTSNQSLISTITWVPGDPGCPAINATANAPRPTGRIASILTCLGSVPPAGSFRPPFSGTDKPLFNISELHPELLPSYPVVSNTPALSTVERYVERAWLDHNPEWNGCYAIPEENQEHYGREVSQKMNDALLYLMLDVPDKTTLLYRVVQIGIDYYHSVLNGMYFGTWGGGWGHGRKMPILFAGMLLDNQDMKNIGYYISYYTFSADNCSGGCPTFQEDCQTFYVTQADKSRFPSIFPTIGAPGWGQRHCSRPASDDLKRQYRTCCTVYTWGGAMLTALMLNDVNGVNGRTLWNHEPFFDVVDSYVAEGGGVDGTVGENPVFMSAFVREMWRAYRNNIVPVDPTAAATPVISPNGGTHAGSVTISITTSTTGATIYYTDNGTTPDESSIVYNQPFTITSSKTIKTIAYKAGLDPSAVKTADFTIQTDNQSPTIESVANTHNANQVIAIFSESVTTATAENTSNYSIDNGIAITAASLGADQKTVTLSTSTLSSSTTYTLTVNNIEDFWGNVIAANSTATFQYIDGQTSDGTWQSFTVSTQTGTFTATFDAIPNGNNIDAITGIQNGSASAYGDLACIVRFNTSGQLDARNGSSYTSTNTVNYSSGTSYHFRLEIDVPSHTYSVYVTPQGQSEVTLASNFAFRTEQASVSQLTGWAIYAYDGSHLVGNMSFSTGGGDTEAPSVPASLTAGTVTTNSIGLSWNASTDNVGVAGYKVYTDGSNPVSVAGTSTTISGLSASTQYSFTISAYDAASNESAQSSALQVTTDDPADTQAPSVPTSLTASTVTTNSVDLSWNASTDNVGVTGYKVYTNGANPVSVAGTSTTISGLSTSTQYSFTVSAIDAASNESAQSSALQVTTQSSGGDPIAGNIIGYWSLDEINGSTTPDESGNGNNGTVTGAIITSGQIDNALNFDGINDEVSLGNLDVVPNSGNDGITLAAWINPDQWVSSYEDDRIISKATGTGEQDHYWMLSPISSSNETRLRFRLKTGTTTETLISSSGDIQLNTWTHVAATYDGSVMKVYINGSEVGSVSKTGTVATSASVEATIGINPDGQRPFDGQIDEVYILDLALTVQEISDLMTRTTSGGGGDTEAPSVPTSLTAGAITTSSVALSWNASTDNVGVTGYKVYTDGANPVTVAGTSTTISGLSASTQYSFTVSAIDAASNESAQSSAIQATTATPPDTEAPSVPTGLASNNITTSSVDLSWSASIDNVGVTGYKVYTDGANPVTVTGTSTTISGLSASTQYGFTVSAIDAASNESAQSSVLQVTTSDAAETWIQLTYDDFESGWGNFKDGGGDCIFYTGGTYAHQGNNAAQVQDNTSNYSAFRYYNNVDVQAYSQLKIEFWFYATGMNDGHSFFVEYTDNGGSTWQSVAEFVQGPSGDFINDQFYSVADGGNFAAVIIDDASYNFTSTANIQFRCNGIQNDDQAYFDEIRVTAFENSSQSANVNIAQSTNKPSVNIYPNPLNGNVLNVNINGYDNDMVNINIYDLTSRSVYNQLHTVTSNARVPVGELSKGIYIISIQGKNLKEQQKLVIN